MTKSNEHGYHHGNLASALLAAAERRLRADGQDQLSLRELAREIGVSHAAPRRHFADRQALLDALAKVGFSRIEEQLSAALAEAGDGFAARLRATVTAYILFATENAALLDLMYVRKYQPDADQVAEAAVPAFTLMHELIIEGQLAGELAKGDPQRVGLVIFATMQGIATLINGRMVKPELLNGLVETAIEQFLRAAHPR